MGKNLEHVPSLGRLDNLSLLHWETIRLKGQRSGMPVLLNGEGFILTST